MQSNFGCGYLFGVPLSGGTPRMFAAAQDISIDLKYDLKGLYGQSSFPIEQARAKGSIDIKISTGRIDPDLFNSIFFNATSTVGEILTAMGESGTVPTTPFTITVANAAQFKTDLGVYDVGTGLFLTRVASAPATGQYSVNSATGVYTFAAADTGKAVKFYYTYGSTSTGKTTVVANTVMDTAPAFRLVTSNKFSGKQLTLDFGKVQASALSLPFKLDDFVLPQFTAAAQEDAAGNIFTMTVTG